VSKASRQVLARLLAAKKCWLGGLDLNRLLKSPRAPAHAAGALLPAVVIERLLDAQGARSVFNVCMCLRHVSEALNFGIFLIVPKLHRYAAAPKLTSSNSLSFRDLVGARGFEPRASCAQGRRATRLRYAPTFATHGFYGILGFSTHGGLDVAVREFVQNG
jgi:hypothetical protein